MKAFGIGKLKLVMSMLLVMMLVFVAACGGNSKENGDANNAPNQVEQGETNTPAPSEEPAQEEPSVNEGETIYPLTVTDATGTEVTFEKAPTAIVTLAPSETEVAYTIGAGGYVVGVDEFSNYPEDALSKPKIGDMTTNIEAVVALNPDLVLAIAGSPAIEQLRALNLNVFATDPKSYDAVIEKIEVIGQIVNKQAEAAAAADHMRDIKEQVTAAVKDADKKSVYLEISEGWTVGSGEFLDELITLAGGQNIAASQAGWFEVNAEEVVEQNPQLIIFVDYGEEKSAIVADITERPGWNAIDAVKDNQIYGVAEDPVVRVGPRLADGLLDLASLIHPELVKK